MINKKKKIKVQISANNKKDKFKLIMLAILCLTAIESIALFNGINGTLLRFVVVIISGLVGLMIPTPKLFRGVI